MWCVFYVGDNSDVTLSTQHNYRFLQHFPPLSPVLRVFLCHWQHNRDTTQHCFDLCNTSFFVSFVVYVLVALRACRNTRNTPLILATFSSFAFSFVCVLALTAPQEHLQCTSVVIATLSLSPVLRVFLHGTTRTLTHQLFLLHYPPLSPVLRVFWQHWQHNSNRHATHLCDNTALQSTNEEHHIGPTCRCSSLTLIFFFIFPSFSSFLISFGIRLSKDLSTSMLYFSLVLITMISCWLLHLIVEKTFYVDALLSFTFPLLFTTIFYFVLMQRVEVAFYINDLSFFPFLRNYPPWFLCFFLH